MSLPLDTLSTVFASPVGQQLSAAGLLRFLRDVEVVDGSLRAVAYPDLLPHLRSDTRFASGGLHHLHPDVGDDRRDFRSYRGAFGPGSLQIVVDATTGRCYADIDDWNPYQDVVNFVGHAGEVLRGWWRRVRSH